MLIRLADNEELYVIINEHNNKILSIATSLNDAEIEAESLEKRYRNRSFVIKPLRELKLIPI